MGRVVGRASEKPYQAAMSHLEGMVRAVAKKASRLTKSESRSRTPVKAKERHQSLNLKATYRSETIASAPSMRDLLLLFM